MGRCTAFRGAARTCSTPAGGWLDTLLMRGIDTLKAFPYLLLALALVAALGPGLFNAMLAIIVVNVPFFARGVRGAALSVVRTDFVAAARLCGLSDTRIVLSELLPNVLPGIIIGVSTTVGWMILETAGLSFLGLGAQPPQADLGGMLGEGRNLLQIAPHVATIPGLMILLLAIGINLLGDGLRDVLDPKLKAGGLARSQSRTDAASGEARRRGLPPPVSDARLPLAIRGLKTEFRVGRSIYAAVGGVDIAIAPGEAVGIVGESGSSKTVTAVSVLGRVASPPGRIVGGEILHHGEDMAEADLNRLQEVRGGKIAYVFQDPQTTLRVSTGRQLKGDVSISSRRKAATKHCGEIGRQVVAEFVDGATGTDESRENFQRMIDQALATGCPFDHIVVYAFSRFYRSGPESEVLIRRLAKAGVRVVPLTQPIGDDPSQILMRQMIGILDEHTSKENGKNVRRAMKENAEQGF